MAKAKPSKESKDRSCDASAVVLNYRRDIMNYHHGLRVLIQVHKLTPHMHRHIHRHTHTYMHTHLHMHIYIYIYLFIHIPRLTCSHVFAHHCHVLKCMVTVDQSWDICNMTLQHSWIMPIWGRTADWKLWRTYRLKMGTCNVISQINFKRLNWKTKTSKFHTCVHEVFCRWIIFQGH
jgi:hypothetical protein